ncbi:phage holin family protein [Aerolutibacter ruishenii]|uniref:Putative membrane protein YqjE n=1 Tax=Aerolutibacter ruishenii TaxID=686800 RepID=A0A562M357_9GAMM|nr:phage holin family protein [Lysobacter ruishenii]TWI14375.1 putative membrane protein YqjE [Lysobacter ruishenii]
MGASGTGDDRATPNDPGTGPAPGLDDALRDIGDTGKATLKASVDAAKAFRTLVLADISLARSALGRALAFTGVAIAFGASAWLLLMAALIVFLSNGLGWSWTLSLLLTALLSLAITVFGGWSAIRYFEHTRLQATRRQLARLGIGELAEFTPTPGSPESTREATEAAPPETPAGEPAKDKRGVDITPP